MTSSFDIERLLAPRVLDIESSGIRKAWALAATCVDPINLSIGQPDFPVPDVLKTAAIEAIRAPFVVAPGGGQGPSGEGLGTPGQLR